jgi:hypothetical protein
MQIMCRLGGIIVTCVITQQRSHCQVLILHLVDLFLVYIYNNNYFVCIWSHSIHFLCCKEGNVISLLHFIYIYIYIYSNFDCVACLLSLTESRHSLVPKLSHHLLAIAYIYYLLFIYIYLLYYF